MLPTHVVRMPEVNERSSGGGSRGTHSSSPPSPPTSYPPSAIAASGPSRRALPRGITAMTVDVGGEGGGKADFHAHPTPPLSRWQTREFSLYYLVLVTILPLMVWVPIRLSSTTNPNYPRFRSHLTQGWLFGRQRDNSDFQYRSFRDYVPALVGIMVLYLVCAWAVGRVRRVVFLHAFSAVFVLALHGSNTLKLGTILLLNYGLAHSLAGRKYVAPVVIWTFNVGTLAAVHWNDGFQWSKISGGGDVLAWLDEWNGLLPRWQINFNITMLRLVSFALDLHWSRGEQMQNNKTITTPPDSRTRSRQARPHSEYNLSNYFLYTLYPPLFIAGPIMTFNDFTSQLRNPLPIPTRSTCMYALRFLLSLLTMEFILHFMYVNAIKDTHAWKGESPLELSMVGFWNLIIVWLKLLLPWRFFRLWALADGVDPPENMIRCMANNYSTLGFWRSWHRSYNLWIVRYIYIPVGGARNTYGLPATLLVFTFVALWHDLSLKLLTWGWLVTAFIVPELIAKAFIPAARYGSRAWYRHVAALGGVFNVLLMMTANLVGFAIGIDGIQYMWQQILGSWGGVKFLLGAVGALFVGVQIMFEYREAEARRGIYRKC